MRRKGLITCLKAVLSQYFEEFIRSNRVFLTLFSMVVDVLLTTSLTSGWQQAFFGLSGQSCLIFAKFAILTGSDRICFSFLTCWRFEGCWQRNWFKGGTGEPFPGLPHNFVIFVELGQNVVKGKSCCHDDAFISRVEPTF